MWVLERCQDCANRGAPEWFFQPLLSIISLHKIRNLLQNSFFLQFFYLNFQLYFKKSATQSVTFQNEKDKNCFCIWKGISSRAILNIHPHKSKSKTDKYLFSSEQNIISPAPSYSSLKSITKKITKIIETWRKQKLEKFRIVEICDGWWWQICIN